MRWLQSDANGSAATLGVEQLEAFLAAYPPFDAIEPSQRAALARSARARLLGAGELALVEDGVPARALWLILTGSIELVHEGEVIDVLEPGECFGHPSLLTGMAPAFTVRGHEQSLCALLAAREARAALGTEAGASYVAATLRGRLVRQGHTVHGLQDVGTTPVSAILRPAVWCSPDERVGAIAARLGVGGVSALLVRMPDQQLGIVTDAEVRAGLAANRDVFDRAAAEIARVPVATVPVGQLAVEATVDLLAAGAEHAAVLDGDQVRGLLSAGDLLGLDARSPIALRHTVLGAADRETLIRAVSHLPQLFALLQRAGVPPRDLGRVLSLQHDAVVGRLIDFSIWQHGAAPVPWAWLDLGSSARREFTLSSDQDNALAYATGEAGTEADADVYFAQLGADVNDGLAACGIGVDNNGVLAGDKRWRMSKAAWLRTFDECLTQPDESHLIRASVSFDFRPAAGGLNVTPELAARIRAARDYPEFMRLIARSALGNPVALGFRGSLVVDKETGLLDLKRGAILPLVNLVRFHALANGVTISPTIDRIDAVAASGGLTSDAAAALHGAFSVITRVRFEHHAAAIDAGRPADHLIDPGALQPIARAELREALHELKRAQKPLGAWAPVSR
ncbi:MAG: putative nucleotidyltransferase substrate binding domain-containing protein [Solirubrobacteraceae bacterium]